MSSLRQSVNALLADDDLDAFIRTRRAEGASWRAVAIDLYDATGISVTHETLRSWSEPTEKAS